MIVVPRLLIFGLWKDVYKSVKRLFSSLIKCDKCCGREKEALVGIDLFSGTMKDMLATENFMQSNRGTYVGFFFF